MQPQITLKQQLSIGAMAALTLAMAGHEPMARAAEILPPRPSHTIQSVMVETQQEVLAHDGNPINQWRGLSGISDEHQSIFPPGALHGNSDYLFFVSTLSEASIGEGLVVLSGFLCTDATNGTSGCGPNQYQHWVLDTTEGYGPSQLFLSPIPHDVCPSAQDLTFDLNYASPGSVVADPTSFPGSLLMIYEGSNLCIPNSTTPNPEKKGGVFISMAVATSFDYGHSWPVYRSDFLHPGLPYQNPSVGPSAQWGAFLPQVCVGDICPLPGVDYVPPFASYGRYAVLIPPLPQQSFSTNIGDAEPSAFVDDISLQAGQPTYLYSIHGYSPENGLPDGRNFDLSISRAQLNGGSAPLAFTTWNGRTFGASGAGAMETPFLPDGSFLSCGDPNPKHQTRHSGSISYLAETQQYLLVFVCDSQGEPSKGSYVAGEYGSSWFWSTTTNLAYPPWWTTPQQIVGSWGRWTNKSGTAPWQQSDGGPSFTGWYPTLMSLQQTGQLTSGAPGHLLTAGYVFSMSGCQGQCGPGASDRKYVSRAFTITTN